MKVVRVEGCLESNDGQDQGREHGRHVQQLQLLLPLTTEQTVHQSTCKKRLMAGVYLRNTLRNALRKWRVGKSIKFYIYYASAPFMLRITQRSQLVAPRLKLQANTGVLEGN